MGGQVKVRVEEKAIRHKSMRKIHIRIDPHIDFLQFLKVEMHIYKCV